MNRDSWCGYRRLWW